MVYIYDYLTLDKTNWKCLIPEEYVCDGYSHCLTDECKCERTENINPVLYCAQQPGCVTFQQVTNTDYSFLLILEYSVNHRHGYDMVDGYDMVRIIVYAQY